MAGFCIWMVEKSEEKYFTEMIFFSAYQESFLNSAQAESLAYCLKLFLYSIDKGEWRD